MEVSDRFLIFSLFCSIILNNKHDKEFNCIEVGGGHNPIFLYVLKSTNKKVNFQILEEKNFKLEVPDEYKKYINYYYDYKKLDFKNSSCIIFSGSVQYLENYKDILTKVFLNKIQYIFIIETFFTNMDTDIITLQNNMENVKFPNIFFSFEKLNKLFLNNNYKLIYKTKRKVNKYSHNVLNKDDFFIRDLIYKLD